MTTNLPNQEIREREENRARNVMYKHLMSVPHREWEQPLAELRTALETDSDFISRTCVFLATGGTNIRDQVDMGIITLLQAPATFPEYREAGRCLLLGQPVYAIRTSVPAGLEILPSFPGLPPFRIFRIAKEINESEHKVPRLMKSIMRDYLWKLETNDLRWDSVAMMNRKAMHNAYMTFHVHPSERARLTLHENNPPEDSSLATLKLIANSTDPNEQARLLAQHKIPYRIASTIMPKMSPAVAVALIDAMSPTEALNSRSWIESSGVLEMREVKDLFLAKIANATASIASADHRKSAQGSDEEVEAAVVDAKQKAVEKAEKIEKNLLILVDRSGSMENAIETAVQFGARIAPLCVGDFMVVYHNDMGKILDVEDRTSLASWEKAFKGIPAGGSTQQQRGLQVALQAGFEPEAIVMITDGGENGGSNVTQTIVNYGNNTDTDVHVIMIGVDVKPNQNVLSERLKQSGLRFDELMFEGDYYLFDQVGALLGGPPQKSIVERIMETELPRRIKE